MKAEMKTIPLDVDRDQINANFEGYKLSLEPIPLKPKALPKPVGERKASPDSQWSLPHVREFVSANGLFPSPWDPNHLFFFLRDGLYAAHFITASREWRSPELVVECGEAQWAGEGLPPSLVFASADTAVLSFGDASPSIYNIKGAAWEKQPLAPPEGASGGVVLVDAVVRGSELSVLSSRVVESEETKAFQTLLNVRCFGRDEEGGPWEETRSQELEAGLVDYAALMREGPQLLTVSNRAPRLLRDSLKPILEPQDMDTTEHSIMKKIYSWGQTSEDACAVYSAPKGTVKSDVSWRLSESEIHIKVGEKEIMSGSLSGPVDVASSTWTIDEEGRLEVTLCKSRGGEMWSDFVLGDAAGEYVPDPEMVRAVSERLKAFTTDKEASGESGMPAFNSQQLEDCDDSDGETSVLALFHLHEQRITHEADLGGRQFLGSFGGRRVSGARELCVRHDVDGLVWAPEEAGELRLRHAATFNALGYVAASKVSKRWILAAPNRSWASIVDGKRHAFVYAQPSDLETALSNRKTGEKVKSLAKQHLISLEGVGEFLGASTSNDNLFLLTKTSLYAALIVQDFEHHIPDDKHKSD